MKFSRFFALLFCSALMFSLVACGEKEEENDNNSTTNSEVSIVGSWRCDKAVMTLTESTIPELNGSDTLFLGDVTQTLTFKSDGTGISVTEGFNDQGEWDSVELSFTYSLEGTTLNMVTNFYGEVDNQTYTIETLDAHKLTMSMIEQVEDYAEDIHGDMVPYTGILTSTFYYNR